MIFGDLGNDWLVGGTGRDTLWGGWGNDLLNADDDLDDQRRPQRRARHPPSYEDRAFGGAGRDVLIGNTGGDRLIDWVGEFNSYLVPFAPFGLGTVSRQVPPAPGSSSTPCPRPQGADPTLAQPTGATRRATASRTASSAWSRSRTTPWQDQTGGPRDPQPGNIPGGKRDVLRAARLRQRDHADGLLRRQRHRGRSTNGRCRSRRPASGGDAASVFYVDEYLPVYYEIAGVGAAQKPTGGWKANAYVIFDYFSADRLQVRRHRRLDQQAGHGPPRRVRLARRRAGRSRRLKADTVYKLLLAVNGTTVDAAGRRHAGVHLHLRRRACIDGVEVALNKGFVGMGSDNARGIFDNVRVQVLPPQVTYDGTSDLTNGTEQLDDAAGGTWTSSSGLHRHRRRPAVRPSARSSRRRTRIPSTAWSRGHASSAPRASPASSSTATATAASSSSRSTCPGQRVLLGHLDRGRLVVDTSIARALVAGTAYTLMLTLKGASASLTVNGASSAASATTPGW